MLAFLLIFNFCLLLAFGGYTSGWELFDFWWSGGAVICGALLLQEERPVRFHLLGLFLVPALAVLILPQVWTSAVVQSLGWCLIVFFLMIFVPTSVRVGDADKLAGTLFEALRWCGAALTILYAVQEYLDLPVRGFGFARSSEAQILLGAAACCLFKPRNRSIVSWAVLFGAGIYLNGSRSALLGLGILAVVYFWIRHATYRKGLWVAALVAAAVLAAVAAITIVRMERDPHAELRMQVFTLAAQIFCEFPLGSGAGTFLTESLSRSFPVLDPRFLSQYAKVNGHAHNVLLQWAAEGGILGMATAAAVIACVCMLLVQRLREKTAAGCGWPVEAAAAWCPAFVLELMINVTESLSPFRWLGLIVVVVLTADYSITLMNRSARFIRLGMILLGGAMMFAGINDLFARQDIRIGIGLEQRGMLAESLESYEEARVRRPWDEQPLLHIAHVAIPMGRFDAADEALEKALQGDEGQGAVRYHGANFYLDFVGIPFNQKSRYLMLSMNDLQPYDVPRLLDGAAWSRSEPERVWRLRRVLSLEPRAARAYDELARISAGRGDTGRSESYSALAHRIRQLYLPDILRGLAEFSPSTRNVSRYEIQLIDKPNSM